MCCICNFHPQLKSECEDGMTQVSIEADTIGYLEDRVTDHIVCICKILGRMYWKQRIHSHILVYLLATEAIICKRGNMYTGTKNSFTMERCTCEPFLYSLVPLFLGLDLPKCNEPSFDEVANAFHPIALSRNNKARRRVDICTVELYRTDVEFVSKRTHFELSSVRR
ncbi:hypothetical protein EV401DRAFT_1984262 [Pisolithus croceorrhizus]|nr:hypothetical protein EV401DRAFT_1984262 [Pisolithus croceorrhizus]